MTVGATLCAVDRCSWDDHQRPQRVSDLPSARRQQLAALLHPVDQDSGDGLTQLVARVMSPEEGVALRRAAEIGDGEDDVDLADDEPEAAGRG